MTKRETCKLDEEHKYLADSWAEVCVYIVSEHD